jgi:hypothetical protein
MPHTSHHTNYTNFIIKSKINGLSDHDAQLIILNDEILTTPASKTNTTRSFNNSNIATFLNYLSYENWSDVFTEKNTNSIFNNFLNIFLRGFNYGFPIYRKHINLCSQNKWITKGIMVSCKKKELFILNKYTQNLQIKTYYKKYCAILTKVILEAKRLLQTGYRKFK